MSERWCVHVQGPDDLIAMRTKAEAEAFAATNNAYYEDYAKDKGPHFPKVLAVVIEWPHGPMSDEHWEEHCKDSEPI